MASLSGMAREYTYRFLALPFTDGEIDRNDCMHGCAEDGAPGPASTGMSGEMWEWAVSRQQRVVTANS